MAGKKKKKGEKGKKDKENGLPPPPSLEQTRQGATEALLTFQIKGKEEAIEICEEEAEDYKEKNHSQKDRNYQLKLQQTEYYKKMRQDATELQTNIDGSENVERESIDSVLKEKLKLEAGYQSRIRELNTRIAEADEEIELLTEEVEIWTLYKTKTRSERSEYITELIEAMDGTKLIEEALRVELARQLDVVKATVDAKLNQVAEKQRIAGAHHAVKHLDKDTRAERIDNFWLSKQISLMKDNVHALRKEVDALEQRNIKFIHTVSEAQANEMQVMSDMYNVSIGRGRRSQQAGLSGLPSLVDVSKCTSETNAGGQVGSYEMQLLTIEGRSPAFFSTPDTVHLPPIEQQRSTHNALPPRTNWPISNTMLSSILTAE